jgi:hypothetical protein
MTDQTDPLSISGLDERHPGLTKPMAGMFTEAATVCLSRHHTSPVEFAIQHQEVMRRQVHFERPSTRVANAHANETDATEVGAYCVGLAAIEATQSLVAVRRAETGTGADWYVAPVGTNPDDLEDCYRLEVSGVDRGGRVEVSQRLSAKVQQTRRGSSNLPAIATVVGFLDRSVMIAVVKDEA